MNHRSKKTLLTITAIAALGVPGALTGAAQARQGADDPVGHVRHSGTDDNRPSTSSATQSAAKSKAKSKRTRTRSGRRGRHHTASHRRGADDGRRGRGRGTDDGPNHR
jgi:hypothetical protein